MNQWNSALYEGRVRHTRLEPFHHDFEYSVYYGLFDLDELANLDAELRLLSVGRFNLFGFDPRDHGPADGSDLRKWAEHILARADIRLDGGRIELLAFPRVLGHVFDPISIWYCYDADGELRAVLHEVRNTFGDRHVYAVPINGDRDLKHSFGKDLHVSPFNDMDQTYSFTITRPGKRLAVAIDQWDGNGHMFRAGMGLTRVPLTDRNLLRMFLTHPLVTIKVVVGIHWQALRIWLKGGRYHRRPEPSVDNITIVETTKAAG